MSQAPPRHVVQSFGGDGEPVRVGGGMGGAWRIRDIVLKREDHHSTHAAWQAEVLSSIRCDGFRVPCPRPSAKGGFVVDGWTAWEWVQGRHEYGRWAEIIEAGERFHAALIGIPRPGFIGERSDPWVVGDRVAWGDLPVEAFRRVKHLERLADALRPVDAASQVIHGDLGGNVLFAEGLAPAIIDFSPYWRPTAYASAIVVADALAWEDADESLLDAVAHIEQFEQFFLRALIYRVVTDRLFRENEPIRPDDADPYLPVVELAVHL
jgi:uncharacterized protein (TIGR02569 family)